MNQAYLYAKANGVQKSDATYVLENYFRLVRWKKDGEESILDIGCGTGDVTMDILQPLLPKNYGKLVGADVSENMVDFANSHYKQKKVSFITMDVATKELPVDMEEEFHHIFSFYCLHWIQDQRQAAENIYRLLKPGGDILLTFLASNPIYTIYNSLQQNNRWAKYMGNLKDYVAPYHNSKDPEKDYDKVLRQAGFKVHLCKVVERKYVYANVETLRKAVLAVNPFIPKIPSEMVGEYMDDYINEVRKMKMIEVNHNNNEGKIHVPYKLFVVFASKQM